MADQADQPKPEEKVVYSRTGDPIDPKRVYLWAAVMVGLVLFALVAARMLGGL